MTWHAKLDIQYKLEDDRTVARYERVGPLQVLQSLYPEGNAVCHNVLVHPPGGLVGGDTLDITINVAPHAHGLITTPGATRFYKSLGEPALQRTSAKVQANGRLEWLPLEAIAYNDCSAENQCIFQLDAGAEMMGWDVTALGLPHADMPFESGSFTQHIELPGIWLERGKIEASDQRLLNSPIGLAGQRCMGSLFFASGSALQRDRVALALAAARMVLDTHALKGTAGATSPNDHVVVVRVLAPMVEPVMDVLRQVWTAWRQDLWQLKAVAPRIWAM
ncbi:MAG: urease accessory protein UreD [Polaromonas sp.]|nr:urease accessory protein UreD [Polaromonas sp.]MBL0252002.1 urease accessory protein UreD [Polaromonas sp.]MBP6088104.1 urease accessory protein UreD [Polaromonas sp.]MBP6141644.1 urease accessory protein UreD [Polaromonas sp.]MBP6155891.1 urease accessory protein UreD [Polaromonas sp.]